MGDARRLKVMNDEEHNGAIDHLLKVGQVGQFCGLHPRTIWRHLSAGLLPEPVRIAGSVRWRMSDIRAWMDCGCNMPLFEAQKRKEVALMEGSMNREQQIAAEAGYQIVHEAEFDEQLAEATGSIFRGDELIRDVELILARNPNRGYRVAQNWWCFEKREGGSDLLLIVYMFNEAKKEVHLRSIGRSAGVLWGQSLISD